MSRTTRPILPLLALGAAIVCTGCGPFGYLKKVARDATKSVADAEAAGAEKYAPYEYWGAVTYLEQSKILMGYSEYERSFDYGARARQLAVEAKRKADMRERGATTETDPNVARPSDIVPPPADEPKSETQGRGKANGGKAKGNARVKVGGGK